MRTGSICFGLPYFYRGPKSTGKRIVAEVDRLVLKSQLVTDKLNSYLRFNPVRYMHNPSSRQKTYKKTRYSHHRLILILGKLLPDHIDYKAYKAGSEEAKADLALRVAVKITAWMLTKLDLVNDFHCEKSERGEPGLGYLRTTTIEVSLHLPDEATLSTFFP